MGSNLIVIAAMLLSTLQPAPPQDVPDRRRWEGYMVMPPLTPDSPQWAQDLIRDGRFYAIWVNELVSGYAGGAVSEQEFLQVMWDGLPQRMQGLAEMHFDGELSHVSPWLMLNSVAMQSMGVRDIVEGEPIFYDPRQSMDEDGQVLPDEQRSHQAALRANAIMKEVFLLARRGGFDESEGAKWLPGSSTASCKRVRLTVPAQVTPDDIHVWADVMRLSDAQLAQFLRLHAAYVAADDELRELLIDPVMEQFEQLQPQLHRASSDIDIAEQIRSLQQRISAAVQQIIDAERVALFDEMAPVLTDAHRAELKIVRARRMRDVYKVVGSCLDGASIDLSELLPETIDVDSSLTPDERKACRKTLAIYESELTELHRRHHDAKRDLMTRGPVLKASQDAASNPQRLQSQYDELLTRVLDAERAILELHEMYLPMVSEHLPEDVAGMLADAYHAEAYPQVYPNPYDPSGVIAAALALDGLTEKQREELQALRDLASQQQERICNAMRRGALEWEISLLQKFTIDMSVRFAHYDKMDAWHTERREACELSIESLYGVLGEQYAEAMRPQVRALWSEAAQCVPRITGTHYYPAASPSMNHLAQ